METPLRVVYALDVGKYKLGVDSQVLAKTTVAWCRVREGASSLRDVRYEGTPDTGIMSVPGGASWRCGRNLEALATSILADLADDAAVALGFEAPMWFPLHARHSPQLDLFTHRFDDERGSQWYLQSGAAASLKAVGLGRLLLDYLAEGRPDLGFTTSADETTGRARITVFEAFVAGEKFKIDCPVTEACNEWDALLAALAWGGVHGVVEIPQSWVPITLHQAGSATGETFSVWNALLRSTPFASDAEGPLDCEVVAVLDSKLTAHPGQRT